MIVSLCDMPTFADQLASRGVHGQRMALYYYGLTFGLKEAGRPEKNGPKVSAKDGLETARLNAAARMHLSGVAH